MQKNCAVNLWKRDETSDFFKAKFSIKYVWKIIKILIITQEIMPTDLEFAYNYNQIDAYILNGNNKLWTKVVLYESEIEVCSCWLR